MITKPDQVKDLDMNVRQLVTTSNAYVKAKYELGVNEEKILYCAIITAREIKRGFDHNTFVEVRAADYAELTGLDIKESYQALRRTANTLQNRFVIFQELDPITGKDSELKIPLVTGIRYVAEAGVIRLRFAAEIIPHFTQLVEGSYTSHEFKHLAKLSSSYAIRLYRLFHMEIWKKRPIELALVDMREIFSIGDKYPAIKDFKANIVDIAVDQINQRTDLFVSYENIKNGRTVTGLEFTVKKAKAKLVKEAKLATPIKKSIPFSRASAFAGIELHLLKEIQTKHPEITEKDVMDYAEQAGIHIIKALEKIKAEYKASDEFNLE